MNNARAERITQLLTAALQPTHLTVTDDSHLHRGHAGAAGGAGHFTVAIAAPSFAGCSRIQCHQKVYQALSEMMGGEIHALAIRVIS